MKTVLLIRHAKSSWDIPELDDYLRPLNQRGYDDANKLSEFMQQHQLTPGVVLSSPAVRTVSTALIIMHNLDISADELLLEPGLYESTVEKYAAVVNAVLSTTATLALIGHNDTITEFAAYLTGTPVERLKTSTMVVIDFEDTDKASKLAKAGKIRLRFDAK